jgi:hypothetical protein
MSRKHVMLAKACFWKTNQKVVLDYIAGMTATDMNKLTKQVPFARKIPLEEKRQIASAAVLAMSDRTIMALLRSLP